MFWKFKRKDTPLKRRNEHENRYNGIIPVKNDCDLK